MNDLATHEQQLIATFGPQVLHRALSLSLSLSVIDRFLTRTIPRFDANWIDSTLFGATWIQMTLMFNGNFIPFHKRKKKLTMGVTGIAR